MPNTLNGTYPADPGSFSGDVYSASRFLANPAMVARRLQQLSDLRYIGALLLPGRQQTSGGAVAYELADTMFAGGAPEAVAPGAEYKLTTISAGSIGTSRVVKYGQDALVTDEAIARAQGMSPVDRAFMRLVNSQAAAIDSAVVSVVASAVTNTFDAAVKWTAASPTILRDILRAQAAIRSLNMGYNATAILMDDEVWAYLASDPTLANAMQREDASNPVYTGRFPRIAGMEIIPVPAANLPGGVGTSAWLIDRGALGYIATENLGGGYADAGGNGISESKSYRTEGTDGWRIRVRANFVPVVTDPGAGYRIGNVK